MYDRLLEALFALLSWADVAKSGTVLAFGVALFVAHALLHVTLLSILLQIALAALGAGGAVAAHNHLMGGKLPALTVPLTPAAIERACALAAVRASSALSSANSLLSWSHPSASARALAYLTLGVKAGALATSTNLLALWCLAFVAGPALASGRGSLEAALAAFTDAARPLAAALQAQVGAVQAWASEKKSLAQVVFPSLAVAALYFAWPILNVTGMALAAASAVAGYDGLRLAVDRGRALTPRAHAE